MSDVQQPYDQDNEPEGVEWPDPGPDPEQEPSHDTTPGDDQSADDDGAEAG